MLARRGIAAELRWGVRMKAGEGAEKRPELDAHAWLESGGRVVLGEPKAELFRPMNESGRR
jgi:hypothetical protein